MSAIAMIGLMLCASGLTATAMSHFYNLPESASSAGLIMNFTGFLIWWVIRSSSQKD